MRHQQEIGDSTALTTVLVELVTVAPLLVEETILSAVLSTLLPFELLRRWEPREPMMPPEPLRR